jgi:hypothetical protein
MHEADGIVIATYYDSGPMPSGPGLGFSPKVGARLIISHPR